MYRPLLSLGLLAVITAVAPAIDTRDTRMLTHPAVSAKNIAFCYADDLYVADLDGKNVRRLTSDIGFELRAALEPWHVMGEEGVVGGTARYVDSSLERLQIKVEGLEGTRFTIACNGHALPLQPTGTRGEHVAGVRFRAWQPPACLHPTIGIHSPLRFDLVDRWAGRSLGGCTYHVMHPAGRSYDTLPINELEAEGRRLSRFEAGGHTPGPLTVDEPAIHPEFPHTLDLRRFA